MLRTASIFGILILFLTVYVISQLQPGTKNLTIFYVTFGLWGMFTVLCNPNLESIFADSVETGTRSSLFANKAATIQIASAMGPFLTIAYYAFLGEGLSGGWKLSQLRIVLLFGTGICLVSLLFLWMFNDDNSLGDRSEAAVKAKDDASNIIIIGDRKVSLMESPRERKKPRGNDTTGAITEEDLPCCFVPRHVVPYVIAIGDVGTAVGAGMTVKFFPLFFVDRYLHEPNLFVHRILYQPNH